jgi:hypothetical protein
MSRWPSISLGQQLGSREIMSLEGCVCCAKVSGCATCACDVACEKTRKLKHAVVGVEAHLQQPREHWCCCHVTATAVPTKACTTLSLPLSDSHRHTHSLSLCTRAVTRARWQCTVCASVLRPDFPCRRQSSALARSQRTATKKEVPHHTRLCRGVCALVCQGAKETGIRCTCPPNFKIISFANFCVARVECCLKVLCTVSLAAPRSFSLAATEKLTLMTATIKCCVHRRRALRGRALLVSDIK